jgi:thiol-disulfide isomerase/thioredoxin
MKWKYLWVILPIAAAFYFWSLYHVPPSIESEKTWVEIAPGNPVALSSLINKGAVVHYYATWCGPCMREIPEMNEHLGGSEAKRKVIMITDDPWDKIELLKSKVDGNFIFARVASLKACGIYSIPVTYFAQADGSILYSQVGPVDWTSKETIGYLDLLK